MHHGKDSNFVIADCVQQAVREASKRLTPYVAADDPRSFGIAKDMLQRLLDSEQESLP
jgi:hypothetical protein